MKKKLTALFLTLLLVLGLFALPAQASAAAPAAPTIVSGYTHALLGKSKTKYVWITPEAGQQDHKKSCRTIKIRYKVKMKLSEAKKKGYTRCKVCKPSLNTLPRQFTKLTHLTL